jgi:hypothetical protein
MSDRFQTRALEPAMNESGHLLDACPRGGYARLAAEFLKVRDDLFRMIVDILKNGP